MKLALAIAQFLKEAGIRHVFCISGGASLHIIHGIADTEGIEYVCPQSEQAAGFAADAYARLTGMGCALATSGPGATNLVTPIAAAFYDSVPLLFLTGQVASFRLSGGSGVRQTGFQETPIVGIVRSITKYAVQPQTPQDVIPELRTALRIAQQGRMGPVLVDICDDFQRAEIS